MKNLLELKNATRVIDSGQPLDGNWGDAQAGWAIVFTPVNQDGRAPWSIVKDVLFERNYLTNAEHGINILGRAYSNVCSNRRVSSFGRTCSKSRANSCRSAAG